MLMVPKLKKKKSHEEKLLKRHKNFHPLVRSENRDLTSLGVLTRPIDCTDEFDKPDNETQYFVQYYMGRNSRDLMFDIRMFPRDINIKRLCDTMMITAMSGKLGIKKVIEFINSNKMKFIKIRKRLLRDLKRRRQIAIAKSKLVDVDPRKFKKHRDEE